MLSASSRLTTLKLMLNHVYEGMQLQFGFRLWDGTRVPAAYPPTALACYIADEGAVAALIRKPNLVTLCNLWAAKRLDIDNGTFFDVAEARPKVRSREFRKKMNKMLALKTAAQFAFVSRGEPWPLESIGKDHQSDGSQTENKANIAYHYDVSNAFYELWLDKEMVYTCAHYHDWSDDLDTTQIQKLDMVCRKLRLKPGDHVLDMGCGWGAFSCYAAQHYGVTCYGVTLSEQQVAYANDKIKRFGLQDKVIIELKDYALVEGSERFDKVAAIGMMEHVGLENFDKYFQTVHRLLKPGGKFLHHAITRPGGSHAARTGKKRPEFAALTRYIFPGGELDYIGRTATNLERNSFEVRDVESWREHYMRTCKEWHDRLLRNYDAAVKEAGEVNTRIWLIYLAACSIAFQRNNCGLYQTLAVKRVKTPTDLPASRADWYR